MIELQKLKIWAEAEKEKANKGCNLFTKNKNFSFAYQRAGKVQAFSEIIEKLNLLLLKDESKQPQPPDFANTMLGEVPHEVSVEHQKSSQAVEGATPVVRQNEQTNVFCPYCGNDFAVEVKAKKLDAPALDL